MSGGAKPAVVAMLDSVDGAGRGLRIEFLRLEDRYAHRILAVGCEELPVPLLESCENTTAEEDPASPVLQALNVDDLAGDDGTAQRAAMLLGMSAKGHWSLSVQGEHGDRHAVTFDAACRIQKLPKALGSLGSSYVWGKRVDVDDANHVPRLHFGSGICVIELGDDSSGLPWICDRHLRTLVFSPSRDSRCDVPPLTLRWRYRMFVADA